MRRWTLLLLCAVCWPLSADDPEPGSAPDAKKPGAEPATSVGLRVNPDKQPLQMTLRAAIVRALANNLDIRVEAYTPQINAREITTARSVFDPVLFGSLSRSARIFNSTPTPRVIEENSLSVRARRNSSTKSTAFSYAGGLRKATATGGQLQLQLSQTRNQDFRRLEPLADEPRWSTTLEAQLSQSLLRGAGLIVNRAPILIAENTRDSSLYDFQRVVMQVVTDVELRYFDLLLARENLRVARKSNEVLVGLRKQTQALVRAGQDPKVKLVQADANVQNSELQIIVRENAVRDAEDQLKNLIDPTNGKLLDDVELIPSESLGEQAAAGIADLPAQVQSALAKRPELLSARTNLNSAHLRVITAKNGMLPLLDITGTLAYEGGRETAHESWRELGEFRFFTWTIGLTLEVPLGNRAARAALEQAKLRRDQAKAQLTRLERNIVVEVRRAFRGVATARKRIRSAAALLAAREDQFKAEQARYRAGDQVTLFELSRFNEDRIQAETDLVAARIDLLQALARLRQAAASTLDNLERRGLLVAGADRAVDPEAEEK